MRIIWLTNVQYRGFFSSAIATISVISSHTAEVASGLILGDCLALVVDGKGRFCDLELTLADVSYDASCKLVPPESSATWEPVVTEIDESCHVGWFYDQKSCSLSIVLSAGVIARWWQIGNEPLFLGIGEGNTLMAISFSAVIEDLSGELEWEWLDKIDFDHDPAKTTG